MQFPDMRITPHFSFSPSNFNSELFNPNLFNHSYILPKQHFYPTYPKFDDALLNNEVFMQTFIEPSAVQPQFVFNTQNTGNGKNLGKNSGRGKGGATSKGRNKKDKGEGTSNKGKRQSKGSWSEELGAKKMKTDKGTTTNPVISFSDLSAEAGLDQPVCEE